jgi:hypothetical protein
MTGFTEKEVESLITGLSEALHEEENQEADDVPETPETEGTISRHGDVWRLGEHSIHCGDSDLWEVDNIVRQYIKDTDKTDVQLVRDGEEQGREVFEDIFPK